MKFLSSERLSQHKYKTPEGYLICVDAILARTGKQTYRKNEVFADSEDDSEIEVDRKAEEVFSPATLASFENKPITVEHPDEDVNAGNHNELSVGFVRDVHKGVAEGQDVMLGTLVITDAQTIAEIENGEHTDLSCGYDCDIIDEENPQQRNIRGNHVALCQQGRAGIARIVDSTNINNSKYFMATFETHSDKWGDDEYSIFIKANDIYEAEKKARERANIMNDKFLRIKEGNHSEYLKFRARGLAIDSVKDANRNLNDIINHFKTWGYPSRSELQQVVDFYRLTRSDMNVINEALGYEYTNDLHKLKYHDSVKDEDIFKVDVSSAEDRDVSRFITEAQNMGFTTEDKGYTIYLKNGNRDMLNRLKARTHTTIKFVDSVRDYAPPYAVWVKKNGKWTIWGGTHSTSIDKSTFIKEGYEDVKVVKNGEDVHDSVKDTEYRIVNYNNNWYYEIKQDDGFTKLVGPYTSQEEAKKYFMKHRPNEKLKDAQSVMFKGENTFIFANKDMIPERTHYKGDVEYNGKEYYYHEGFDTKRKYLVPITDSIQDYVGTLKDINSGYAVVAKKYYDRFGMNSNVDRVCKTLDEARYIKNSLSFNDGMYFIIIDCNNGYKITDELIQSSSEEAFDKNIATEIKSGKDPKQAAAIAYSIKRKNDSKKYEVSYVDGDVEHIHIVRAKDLKDAINNFKDGFYGGIEESKLRASRDFILKRLFAELDNLKKQPSSVKQENDIYDIKQQLDARVKQIRREFE